MISFRFWPVAAVSAASLLTLVACGPSSAPYEPPPPAPQSDQQAELPDAALAVAADSPAAPAA
ncbi:MAG TPA: hypothetical protein DCG58_18700, partial [Hyphomonas adhaerens]|nr:hypothetical protein [Hyphomonas adhaerens]